MPLNTGASLTGIDFSVINSFISNNKDYNENGIGIENIRKRLDLHYSNNYKLEHKTVDNKYRVHLSIFNTNKIQNA